MSNLRLIVLALSLLVGLGASSLDQVLILKRVQVQTTPNPLGVASFSLGHSSPGFYYTTISIGTPPVDYKLLIDTGSDLTWVTCSSCWNCSQNSTLAAQFHFYNPDASSTGQILNCSDDRCPRCNNQKQECGYVASYLDQSRTTGLYTQDIFSYDVSRANTNVIHSSASLIFGCSSARSGSMGVENLPADGLMGLGPGKLSTISQLSSQGAIPRVFSHCLLGEDENGAGGVLVFGRVMKPDILYTPMAKPRKNYNVDVENIMVGLEVMPIDPFVFSTGSHNKKGGTVVDSGTGPLILVAEAYDIVYFKVSRTALSYGAQQVPGGDRCFYLAPSEINKFPQIRLNFVDGVAITLQPEDYLNRIPQKDGSTIQCIGFLRDPHKTVLGGMALRNRIIVYDLANNQIGISMFNVNCSLPLNVSLTASSFDVLRPPKALFNIAATVISILLLT